MLISNTVRTFPCPHCGEILFEGVTACDYCKAPIDVAASEAAAERHEQVVKANGEANSLVMSARMFLLAFGLSFVPFVSMVGVLAVPFLLVQVPVLCYRWHRRFGRLTYPDAELAEARRWWQQSLLIWGLAVLATPVWLYLRFGPIGTGS